MLFHLVTTHSFHLDCRMQYFVFNLTHFEHSVENKTTVGLVSHYVARHRQFTH